MRLAVVSPFVDRRHGTERALVELLERLACNYNCEIHLYSQRVEDLNLQASATFAPKNANGIFWHKLPSIPGPHLFRFLFWFYLNRFCRWFDKTFRSASFDLVLSPGINCSDADVVIVHALFHRLRELSEVSFNSASNSLNPFRRLHRLAYYRLLTRLEKSIYRSDRVALAAVSSRTADLVTKYFNRKDVAVIPNGVDSSYFCPTARLARRESARTHWQFHSDEFVLLLVGNDWGNKGLLTVLKALAELSDTPTRLLIVGGDDVSPWRELARQIGVFDRCVWEPPCPDILNAYAAADLYVSPSREDSFGLPVAEAMACGLPVITSVFAGVSAFVDEGTNGFALSDPNDSLTLARLCRQLAADTDGRERLARNAVQSIRSLTWDRAADQTWHWLNSVITKKHA